MAVYVYVTKCAVKERFDCLEVAAYVHAFCTWLDVALVVGGHLKSAFVITT
jgi:hypothetical protein